MILPTLIAVLLFAGAVAGALAPYLRPRTVITERLSDPLDDERRTALRTLRDLDFERLTGALTEEDYRTLRAEAEIRAVSVLQRQAARDGTDIRGSVKQIRGPAVSADAMLVPTRSRKAPIILAVAVAAAWAVPAISSAVLGRTPGQPITGDLAQGSATQTSALATYQQQVTAHPDDVAARLNLAQAYSEAANITAAVQQYVAVLRLEPGNPEANTQLGLVLAAIGKPKSGLTRVEAGLAAVPAYPEALYAKGYILLRGLGRPGAAVAPLEEYLRVAPFGAERGVVKLLLKKAKASGQSSGGAS